MRLIMLTTVKRPSCSLLTERAQFKKAKKVFKNLNLSDIGLST